MKALLVALAAGVATASGAEVVLVEAESFRDPGGWVVDPQFMDQMGSPYLLAHGLGRPVADAATGLDLPAGSWRVWVRTMDWVARWNAPGAPGRFRVLLDGRALAPEFGAKGAGWHWQDGGRFESRGGRVNLALHDLTGFEGRCDAILFTTDDAFIPPNRDPGMAAFRRRALGHPEAPVPAGEFDLVVAGGGIAGTCAAITAARLGLSVALVQDRPVLGGNNSSEVRVWLQGARNKEPWPRVGDVVAELEQAERAHYGPANTAELYEDGKKLAVARGEPGLKLFLDHRAVAVDMDGPRVRAVVAHPISGGPRVRLGARWVADCTGDGALGHLAGADFEITPQGRMGACNLWNVKDTGAPVPFPRCPWALDLSDKPFPGRHKTAPVIEHLGGWYWESGFDRDPIAEMEHVRDWNFRAMYGAWDAMKNVDSVLPPWTLNWAAHIMGKRESRRLMGDVVLTLSNLVEGVEFLDGCAPTGWKVDLHLPDPLYEAGFEGDAFISRASFGPYKMPFWIPYRCLYSRNVPNLFMAGRCVSVTHEALGAVRVMRTGGCMGEVVGMAARLCKAHGADPRDVYARHLAGLQELMRKGAGRSAEAVPAYINQGEAQPKPAGASATVHPPDWLARAGTNLARTARVTAAPAAEGVEKLTDGHADLADNGGRWIGRGPLPHRIELAWGEPRTVGAVRVVSGWRQAGGGVIAPVAAMRLQAGAADGTWTDIPGAGVTDNPAVDWAVRFAPIRVRRVRLEITATRDATSRIWEIAVFPGPAP
jgi:hypothetical protein